jgi:hypothetical protein
MNVLKLNGRRVIALKLLWCLLLVWLLLIFSKPGYDFVYRAF